MALIRLDIANFRNLTLAELEPLPSGFNMVYGNNGSGKTSLLEAIHFLSVGRSFRSSQTDRIISNVSEKFSIFAHILSHNRQPVPIGIEKNRDKSSKIRLGGEDQSSIAELTRLIPVRLINSQNYSLLDGGPVFRRKYLDWGIFYLKNDFLSLWQRYDRALKQRNAALRGKLSRKEIEIWTLDLLESALLFNQARLDYVQALTPLLLEMLAEVFNSIVEIDIEYQRGWDSELSLDKVLTDSYLKDAWLGYTQFGPHKADLKVLINGVPAKDFLSRGQQKLFVCGMILAQGKLLSKLVKKHPIFLVDDLPSELDSNSLMKIMGLLEQQKAQVFVTAIDLEVIKEFLSCASKMFHVKQGTIIQG